MLLHRKEGSVLVRARELPFHFVLMQFGCRVWTINCDLFFILFSTGPRTRPHFTVVSLMLLLSRSLMWEARLRSNCCSRWAQRNVCASMRHNKNSSNDGKCRFFLGCQKSLWFICWVGVREWHRTFALVWNLKGVVEGHTSLLSLFLSLCALIVSSCFNKFVFASANNRWFQNIDSDRNRDGDKKNYSENASCTFILVNLCVKSNI